MRLVWCFTILLQKSGPVVFTCMLQDIVAQILGAHVCHNSRGRVEGLKYDIVMDIDKECNRIRDTDASIETRHKS